MLQLLLMQQRPARLQQFNNRRIRLEHLQPVVLRQPIVNPPRHVHIASRIKLVLHSGRKILDAVRRRRVHNPRARIHGHVIGQNAQNVSIQETDGQN